mgnify:CR=1 FL=1
MAFSGSINIEGSGKGIVVDIGDNTLIARIAFKVTNVDGKTTVIEK